MFQKTNPFRDRYLYAQTTRGLLNDAHNGSEANKVIWPKQLQLNARFVGIESGTLHSTLRFQVVHEYIPAEACPRILRHYQRDTSVDADNVAVIPILERIKCVHEAITAPGFWVTIFDGAKDAYRGLRQKWQRSSRRAWNHGAVNGSNGRWAAPDDVAGLRIGSSDSPEIIAIVGKRLPQFYAEPAMSFGGDNGVLKIIGVPVALAAEVEPCLGVLVNK